MKKGKFEIISFQKSDGSVNYCIRDQVLRETMHSVKHDPYKEVDNLYIQQSSFADLFLQNTSHLADNDLLRESIVIWDVGLGCAMNATAAINAYCDLTSSPEQYSSGQTFLKKRNFELLSFENDLTSLDLALSYKELFPHLKNCTGIVSFLENGFWELKSGENEEQGSVVWRLFKGDFFENMSLASAPDVIFFDPFSSTSDPYLWQYTIIQKMYTHCINHPVKIITYSSAPKVRAAFLAAGFYVATGSPAGFKKESTLAVNLLYIERNGFQNLQLLSKSWLDGWTIRASSDKFPQLLPITERDLFEAAVKNHPQFSYSVPTHS
jgi:queuine tRNA-ribosyltransferase